MLELIGAKTESSRKSELFLLLLYKAALDIVYLTLQNKLFGYYGFGLTFSAGKMCAGWALYLVGILLLRTKTYELTDVFTVTIFLLSLAPCIVYYEFNEEAQFWMVSSQLLFLALIQLIFRIPSLGVMKIKGLKISYRNSLLRYGVTAVLLAYFAFMVVTNGLPSLSQLSFENISEVRAASSSSALLSMIQNIVCKIICPIYILIAFREKKTTPLILAVMVVLYSYAVTGFKTYLFILAVVFGVSFFPKLNLKKTIIFGLPAAVIGIAVLYLFTNNTMVYALINERVIFLPAKIKIAYFDYFSVNPFVNFSQSTIGKLFGIPGTYTEQIPNLIGRVYFNRPEMWTNTGFLADAYSNLGYAGMAIISVFVAFIIRAASNQLKTTDIRMKKCIEVLYLISFISLNDGGAISVIFSGGMIFILILLALIDFSERDKQMV